MEARTGHAGHAAHAGHGSELMVVTKPAAPIAGAPTTLELMIHGADGSVIRDFDVVHEQKVHLIIVRDELDAFSHVHPAVNPDGNMNVDYTFPTAGHYRLYADHKPTNGAPTVATAELEVENPAATVTHRQRESVLRGRFASDGQLAPGEIAVLSLAEVYAQDPAAITDAMADEVKGVYGDAGLVVLIEALGFLDGRMRMARLMNTLARVRA